MALLCILTTALFALADASASTSAPSGSVRPRVETAFISEDGDALPAAFVAGRAVADSDSPFEHGRLPLAEAWVPARFLASSRSPVSAETPPLGAEQPLPERPPRS